MGFENTNFIDDLGHEVKEPNVFLGCLSAILIGVLFFGGIAGITFAVSMFSLPKESKEVVIKDGKKAITFIAPQGWACFDKNLTGEPYVMNKLFVAKDLMRADLETVSYKSVKYSLKKMKKDPGDIAKQVRAALKKKELKQAVLESEKVEIDEAYAGYKRVKCVYKNGYGYAVYKKSGLARCYYFKAVQSFMLVMAFKYEDSDKNREEAVKEEAKLAEMWEKAFVPKSN
jgi:hypothetical protein